MTDVRYPVAEKFKALQGEGSHAGTPMAFIRLVGCSVGQKVCTACDTDFLHMVPGLGGGLFTAPELLDWVGDYTHVCISGGEPFDRDLQPLVATLLDNVSCIQQVHIETSGTRPIPEWFTKQTPLIWICISPKPGYIVENLLRADELKVIYPGLGEGAGWMTVEEAVAYQNMIGIPVFLQPRNFRNQLDEAMLKQVERIVLENPTLRLSMQIHKLLGSR